MENRHEDDVCDKELRRRQISKLTPPDADSARAMLGALVDRQTSRLELILACNHEIAQADAAEVPNRLAFDPSPEGDKLRRYVLSAARLVNHTLNTFIKVRKGLEDSSVVPCPLSLVSQDSQAAAEPYAVPSGPPDDGQRTTDHGHSPEPSVLLDETSDQGPRTKDKGQSTRTPRTEPITGPEGSSAQGASTNSGPGKPDWAQIRRDVMAQVNEGLERLNRMQQQRPPAPTQPASRKNRTRAGPINGNKGHRN